MTYNSKKNPLLTYTPHPIPLYESFYVMLLFQQKNIYWTIISTHGVTKKSGIGFMISIFFKINTNLLGIYFILKVRSIGPSGVQKNFNTIALSQDINKSKWDIILKKIGY